MTAKTNTTTARAAHYPDRFRASRADRFIAAVRYLFRFIIPETLAGLLLILFALVILPLILAGL